MSLLDYPIGDHYPHEIPCVVEIPKGSRNKYEYDAGNNAFCLDRVLSSPLHYTTEYGFVPQTLAADGDPADVLIIMEEPTFSGCVLFARPLGLLKMADEKGDDCKVLAVPVRDKRFAGIQRLEDVSSNLLLEIEHFFTVYKTLDGLYPDLAGWEDEKQAATYLLACHERFAQSRSLYLGN